MNGVTSLGTSRKGGEGEGQHPPHPGKMKSESKEVLPYGNGLSVQQGKF